MSRMFSALHNAASPSVLAIRGRTHSAPEIATLLEKRAFEPCRCTSVTANPGADSRLVSLQPTNPGAERFQVLANRLLHRRETTGMKVIVVTSASVGEGKSFVASNLALTLAKECKQKTVLLEGDFHKPVLSRLFGLTTEFGLNSLSEPDTGDFTVYYLENLGCHLLPVASPIGSSFGLLQSPALTELLQRLRNSFDWVVIDSPALSIADANVWCRVADGILLVAREGQTTKTSLQCGLDCLDDPRIIGAIFNHAGCAHGLGN